MSPDDKVSAAGWRVVAGFLFSQIDSMFGEVLGLLVSLFTATSHPGFTTSSLSWLHMCFLVDPHAFLVAHSRLDFSFSQIATVPLALALLDAVSVVKAFWYSGPLRRHVLRCGTTFFLTKGGMYEWNTHTDRWCCLAISSPGNDLDLSCACAHPYPTCTFSYSALDLTTWQFQSPNRMKISEAGISTITGQSSS